MAEITIERRRAFASGMISADMMEDQPELARSHAEEIVRKTLEEMGCDLNSLTWMFSGELIENEAYQPEDERPWWRRQRWLWFWYEEPPELEEPDSYYLFKAWAWEKIVL